MFLRRSSRLLQHQWRTYRQSGLFPAAPLAAALNHHDRGFHSTGPLRAVKPVLLADIGEGIVECEVIQWFVEPEARVEEFSPLCEVQSDKASVEITSRFAGVVKKLYYEAGEMAKVGKPFIDIDIQSDASLTSAEEQKQLDEEPASAAAAAGNSSAEAPPPPTEPTVLSADIAAAPAAAAAAVPPISKFATLATPATRHLSKEHDVDISHVRGTGKDGRVTKEDILNHVQERLRTAAAAKVGGGASRPGPAGRGPTSPPPGVQTETRAQLTNTQLQMFKTMTRSLAIPHFLYADEVDFSGLHELRGRLNRVLASSPGLATGGADGGEVVTVAKLSYLPFIIKAVSLTLFKYPILNARVELDGGGGTSSPAAANGNGANGKPTLVYRSQHNIGVAMDTPSGLVVPVIRDVGAQNVLGIAAELRRLQTLASAGKLTPADMSGGTITVSNIGNIGGTYLSPVIVEREVAILGIGRMRTVPAFGEGEDEGKVVKKHVCNFSWSADHRVVDGATMARAADEVRKIVEEPDVMVMHLR